ncbi:hypothetical protein K7X08_032296 [Anisodus acutangulus]|uniref:Uncharacterized protein n=1 Tax=Anisodus acutangulus TaxID=402998 RepID=A0A9Q1R410_9SOLA|nr:hypothetical protein K7X08_032296 [Anisodus acutangulus]
MMTKKSGTLLCTGCICDNGGLYAYLGVLCCVLVVSVIAAVSIRFSDSGSPFRSSVAAMNSGTVSIVELQKKRKDDKIGEGLVRARAAILKAAGVRNLSGGIYRNPGAFYQQVSFKFIFHKYIV